MPSFYAENSHQVRFDRVYYRAVYIIILTEDAENSHQVRLDQVYYHYDAFVLHKTSVENSLIFFFLFTCQVAAVTLKTLVEALLKLSYI